MRWIFTPDDEADIESLGGKAAALSRLAHTGLSIPEWFVISPAAMRASLTPAQRAVFDDQRTDADASALLAEIEPNAEIMRVVYAAFDSIGSAHGRVAVRSSAIDEDGGCFSFAGQLDSFLDVERQDLPLRIAQVWQSAFAPRIIDYRRQHGIDAPPRMPAVLVQRMVDADIAGVAFAADPISGRRATTLVNAVAGTAEKMVSGEVDADAYRIDNRTGEIERPSVYTAPRLAANQLREIRQAAQICSDHFGRPQDIEWALEAGRLQLLQSRPITTLDGVPDPDGRMRLWDNSNIVESYGGITSPLTFSFARRAYAAVYTEFARLLGMSDSELQKHRQLYANMLGYIEGRVYYNLLNWYRALALLPGFKINRAFMEQMMGVAEGLPAEIAAELEAANVGDRLRDGWQLLRTLVGLGWNYARLPARTERFRARLDVALEDPGQLSLMRLDELGDHYRDLEQRLLLHWDAPLINDLFAMIFHGLLRALAQKWCGEPLDNDLLCAQGGMISAEPARCIGELAQLAAAAPELRNELRAAAADGGVTAARFAAWPRFEAGLRDYLGRFGDRCLEELKLETSTTVDDPRLLLVTVADLAERIASGQSPARCESNDPAVDAQQRVRRALRRHPLRRLVFTRVLRIARRLVRERENLRFERTRVFGHVRRIVLEMGRRLAAAGRIEAERDVFYLEIDELLGVIEGTATTTHLQELVDLRKRNEQDYRAAAPAERFETHGAVQVDNRYRPSVESPPVEVEGDSLQGTGACPGTVEGIVRRIDDPQNARLEAGEILVAPRTDPGWVMLFAGAAGVLVERGSLLSHSAIVTRELGIPSIVALPGLCDWLETGDRVRFDGATGRIERVERVADSAGAQHLPGAA